MPSSSSSPKIEAVPNRGSPSLYAGVVLYDAGSRSREALTFGFEREDFEVFSTEQANEALSLLEVSSAPILAVSIGDDPASRAEALSFIGSLPDRAPKKGVAVVVLGRRELREDALRAGADEFVAWPAFIRDAVTLCRLALASRPEGGGVSGLIEDYEVYFLVRALAAAGRSAVVELERGGKKAQLHLAQGEVVAARVGKLSGVTAFHQLLMWGEAALKLRFGSPPGERKINATIDDLLQSGRTFVTEFERLAARVGGPQATFERRNDRLADPNVVIPDEVRHFAESITGSSTLVDLCETSPWKPFDTIKVCYRLCEMGLVARRDPTRSISPLTAQLAVRDWLLGTADAEPRNTVTEAGRRAAEAYADEAARRASVPDASEGIFGDDKTLQEHTLPVDMSVDLPIDDFAEPPVGFHEVATAQLPAQPTAKLDRHAIEEAPVKEPVFDQLDEDFFAQEHELSRVEPVENFDDLDAAHKLSSKRSWALFGNTPAASPPPAQKAKAPPSKPPPSKSKPKRKR